MRGKLLAFLMGLAVGAALLFGLYLREPSPTAPAPVSAPPAGAESREPQYRRQLAVAQAHVAQLTAENAMLRNELGDLKSNATSAAAAAAATSTQAMPLPSPLAALFTGGSGTSQASGAMEKMMQAALQQQIDSQMSTLTLRLHLTDDQEKKLRGLLETRCAVLRDATGKLLRGEMSRQNLDQLRSAQANPDAAIKNILTSDQQAEYDKYLVDERREQAQMAANVELMQLQQVLPLDSSRQQRAHSALFEVILKHITPAEDGTRTPADFDQILTEKEEALRPILTDEQFQGYQKFVDSQRQMVNTLLQSSTNESAPQVSNTVIVPVSP